ncbi:hypothetical protein [Roseateles sp.]|uniref:hypothetical protein n=1 Tax=Roseateles sp. TaxID=1971397 RepID=UPI00286CC553|nr:hypothetical protein [Roseateles sp.]
MTGGWAFAWHTRLDFLAYSADISTEIPLEKLPIQRFYWRISSALPLHGAGAFFQKLDLRKITPIHWP